LFAVTSVMVHALSVAIVRIWLDVIIREVTVKPPIQIKFTVEMMITNFIPIFMFVASLLRKNK
jgi:hypothetical protein